MGVQGQGICHQKQSQMSVCDVLLCVSSPSDTDIYLPACDLIKEMHGLEGSAKPLDFSLDIFHVASVH